MNKKEIFIILKKLASKRAPPGLENARGEQFKNEVEKFLVDKNIPVKRDVYGNYFIKIKGKTGKKSIAILAHIDEIGGTIRKIKKNGTLEFSKRGGFEGRWLVSKRVKILNKEQKWINGVISGRSPHSTPPKMRVKEFIDPLEMEIYIGANSKEEVINKYHIHIGAPLVFSGKLNLLNPEVDDDIIAGYSMDNLVALTCLVVLTQKIMIKFVNDFGAVPIDYNVFIVATTREEVGTEGAFHFMRDNSINKAIAIDIGIVENTSGTVSSDIKLKDGPVIVWQEGGGKGILDYNTCKKITEVAEKNKLKYQNGVFEFYGSDAGKGQKWLGIPSALIGIPILFSHNVPEISTLSGIESAAKLIFQYIKTLK